MDIIYDLKLHKEYGITNDIRVLRVPGGWIYTTSSENVTGDFAATSCFVPLNNEFKPKYSN